jgi:tetratricopeptide (TPR) repeat protein
MRLLWTRTALAWAAMAGSALAADSWVEVKSKYFTVVSNAGENTARRTSAEFEQVRAAYERMWPGVRLSGKPTVVIALKDEGTLKRWVPGHYERKDAIELASISSWSADRNFLLLRTDSRPTHKDVTPNYDLYRGYLTLLIANSFERRLPLWLSNGFAGVFANTLVRDTEIVTGLPVPWELREFNSIGRSPLRVILAADRDSPLVTKDDERDRFDAQCYVLVHYLLFGGKERSQQLARFQQRWLSGSNAEEALAAFGDLRALEAELPDYAKRPILSYAKFALDTAIASERPPARPLPAVDLLALQASVHVAMHRPAEARTAIAEARAADAQSPLPDDAEGLLADEQKDAGQAAEAYARAAERGSVSANTHYRAAQLAWKSDADAALLARLRTRLERAILLQPTHANAHSFLADTLVDQGEGAAAVPKALRAVELEPAESYHRRALARALHQAGRADEAKKAAERALAVADSDKERKDAQSLVDFLTARDRAAADDAAADAKATAADEYHAACQAGDKAACARMVPDLEQACAGGSASACGYLGWLYGSPQGLGRDAAKAAGYAAKGCAAGDQRSCVEHAWATLSGEGLPKDEAKGRAALDSLCTAGHFPACTRLGVALAGKQTARDLAHAKALLARACTGGEQDACAMAKQIR